MELWKEKIPKKLLDDLEKATAKLAELDKQVKEMQNNTIYRNSFEWRFEFPEVLDDDGNFIGFDVIIGNPPYIRQEEIKAFSNYFGKNFKTFSGKSDLYVYFYEIAIRISKQSGTICFITSGKFFEASYGKTLVDYLIDETEIKSIINFNDLPVFDGVTAYPLIYFAAKRKKEDFKFTYYNLRELPTGTLNEKIENVTSLITSKKIFIKNHFKFVNTSVSDLINKTKNNTISLKEFCGLPIVGVKTGFNEGFLTKLKGSKLIKPYVFGRDVKKYQTIKSENSIIFPYDSNFSLANVEREAEVFLQLKNYRNQLSERAIIKDGIKNNSRKWFEYQQINKTINYEEEYIVYPNVSLGSNFTLTKNAVIDMTAFVIKSNNKYLLAILNSKLVSYLMNIWSISRRGGYLEYKVQYVEKIPIKKLSLLEQEPYVELVNEIYQAREKGMNTVAVENQIDELVYQLYDLTPKEIQTIESSIK